ncbi:hypothetical protein [Caulobacter hibisci]|uniref:Uncharacterized protein n=1 Tax=Caulobacter hibisci TaxID=2035993 RepID=A0ABS0T2R7_9CAUL|nr:hypothetical protein [Caulobacter hibisci]MBI1686172.1 hypothetical protein [Caulobacter hibisci]
MSPAQPPAVDPAEAARMLAEVQAANADLARRAKAPTWYHPALGLLMGGLVAVQGQPIVLMLGYYLVFLVGLMLLVGVYKRHTGLWINGYRAGRTRWVAVGLAVAAGLSLLLSAWLVRDQGLVAAPFVIGAVVAVVVTIGGFVWEAAFRRDLRDGGDL